MTSRQLQAGFGEADITPPVGLPMCGSLAPRTNVGVDDPLLAKALVAEGNGKKIAIVGIDLIGLPRALADGAIAEVTSRTGIPNGSILLSCSHTHSGPYTMDGLYVTKVTDAAYLSSLPALIAGAVKRADAALRPAKLNTGRTLVHHGLHHRRVLCKSGRAFNTWLGEALCDLDTCPQVLGSCGPIDPEMWVLRFDDEQGRSFGAFVNFSLHVNSHFGTRYSADYPGVIAQRLREAYGPGFVSVFTPGACANINPTLGGNRWREGAEFFAEQAVLAAKQARTVAEPITLGAARRDVTVPRREARNLSPDSVSRLRWGPDAKVFDDMIGHIGALPEELVVPVSATHIGPFAIASNPGELFVEHGLTIKRRSPFKHTAVAELTNDIILYQPTREAFEQEGYETLVGANRVAMEGIEIIVDTASQLLEELYAASGQEVQASEPAAAGA